MDRKNTGQLLQELMESNDLDRVLSENDTSFREGSLTDALQRLFGLCLDAFLQQSVSALALNSASLTSGSVSPWLSP